MAYNHIEAEKKWLEFWEKNKTYKFKPGKKVYSIDTPPPTVSGEMHIGHAFSYSQQDFIARFHRMKDGSVFYPFGTDDNGLPTERLVEKLKNVKSKNMQRHEFIELCLKTLNEITPEFIRAWKNLGVSSDYDLYYSTIDENSRKISQKAFLELFKKKLAYKKDFPTIWCPECQTSIAQAELEDKELSSVFSTIIFSSEGKEFLIATTRPELIGACVAIFVNPNDKRYLKLIGKEAKVPLFNFEVPIVGDKSAEIDKGTGAMMVCSYGDKYDVDAINRHKLSPRVIFNKNGTLNLEDYNGMKIKEARKKILQDLEAKGLVKEKKEIKHVVNVHDKCGTEIEFLPTSQWFIKILDNKKLWISQGKKIKWHPEFMFKRYENWVNGLEWDWNISRDRHFGVPIPIWECKKCGEIVLPKESELPVDPLQTKKKCLKCKSEAEGEKMVLDTWATSSLTPQIISSLTKGVNIPVSLRPQGHDIIRTWAFYTIVRSCLHEKNIPWKDIVISGNVSLGGEKMSKSKGNVIDPKEVMAKHGADPLRFWAASSKLGEDLDYQEKDLVTGQKFVNKLLNASNFVFMNLKDYDGKKPKTLEKVDELFLKELNRTVFTTTSRFESYDYAKAKFNTEDFFWKSFCDNYLEIVKKRIYNERGQKKISAQYTLYQSLLTIIKLIAPIMPFVTEEIYQTHFKKYEKDISIHTSKWPDYDKKKLEKWSEKIPQDLLAANRWFVLTNLISKIRGIKTENKKSMNAEIILTLESREYSLLKELLQDLKDVTNAKDIVEGEFKVEFL
ncbi:valine--tRNA ligase [Candidatus Pacearchaeota archaeon]|nr:valine--tRNA ligase [Candidatus Pacearchaeota archaeon]